MRVLPLLLLLASLLPAAFAQTPPDQVYDIDVPGNRLFIDTQIDVKAGEVLKFKATGTLQSLRPSRTAGPEGVSHNWTDEVRTYPVVEAGKAALIGKIGDRDTARAFLIGSALERRVSVDGRLYLGVNLPMGVSHPPSADLPPNQRIDGVFHVHIERYSPQAGVNPSELGLAPLTQSQLDSVATRVNDRQGRLGDRVNFFVIGSENQVRIALEREGWIIVDKTTRRAVLEGLWNSLSKQAYVSMPMSELMLFGRGQDYGYAQGDPLRVVTSRHHFRIWKAPFTVGGSTVWAGAGTHDIGIVRDDRTHGITHRIDPDTDKERDYIAASFSESGMVVKSEYMTASKPVTTAKTASGSEFHSDGRTVILYLTPPPADEAATFGDYFCTVLAKDTDAKWDACGSYLDGGGMKNAKLGSLNPTKYRVLIIPGIHSSCFPASPPFQEGVEVLEHKYNLTVDLVSAPDESSEATASRIAAFIREQRKTDARKFILIGYDKGAPDAQVALSTQPDIVPSVAALVTVAGAIRGVRGDAAAPESNPNTCKGDAAAARKSLEPVEREAFLTRYANPMVPTYSIIAYSDSAANTSAALQKSWAALAKVDLKQDGELTRADAIVPGAKLLGEVRGDHFSIAVPFEKSAEDSVRNAMNKNHFPRAALLEAIVRFVASDLGMY